jgi:hypothetical protein
MRNDPVCIQGQLKGFQSIYVQVIITGVHNTIHLLTADLYCLAVTYKYISPQYYIVLYRFKYNPKLLEKQRNQLGQRMSPTTRRTVAN